MRIIIDTDVDLFYDALATIRAAYERQHEEICPTCGATGLEPCRTREGKRANKRHIKRISIRLA